MRIALSLFFSYVSGPDRHKVKAECTRGELCDMQDMDVPAALKDADSTKEAQLLESWKAYKKGFQEGIALFNKKPKKGIAFMQVDAFINFSSAHVAGLA